MKAKEKILVTVLGAACTFLAAPSFAAGTAGAGSSSQQSSAQQMSQPVAYESDQLMDKEVVNNDGESLGTITNLAIGSNGQVSYVVLDTGGFAGMGGEQIAVPFNQLQIAPDAERITLDVQKDQLTSEFAAFEEIKSQSQQQQQQQQEEEGQPWSEEGM